MVQSVSNQIFVFKIFLEFDSATHQDFFSQKLNDIKVHQPTRIIAEMTSCDYGNKEC